MPKLELEIRDKIEEQFDLFFPEYEDIVDIEDINDNVAKVAKEVLNNNGGGDIILPTPQTEIILYKSFNDIYKDAEIPIDTSLARTIQDMKIGSLLKTYVEKSRSLEDYPDDGLLEIYKFADYNAAMKLSSKINDIYTLLVTDKTWNEIFPEAPIQ